MQKKSEIDKYVTELETVVLSILSVVAHEVLNATKERMESVGGVVEPLPEQLIIEAAEAKIKRQIRRKMPELLEAAIEERLSSGTFRQRLVRVFTKKA